MIFRLSALATSAVLLALPAAATTGAPAGGGLMGTLLFMVPMVLIFYFLLIRPQQQARKKHAAMIEAVKRGDTVVTSGGLIGKVTKVSDQELTVELADSVRVRVMRNMIADVREKTAPVAAND
ncbi:MAG: preprotein translocase subunit YajC [Hyphomonadaceae bacterium]|nr:preprotein translocase subunit YajC [Hyphomonadaceae bacterium]